MTKQHSKRDVTVFGPDENARFTVHLSDCRGVIGWGHLEQMTILVSSRREVVADLYGFLDEDDQASTLEGDFDFCSCLQFLN